jgi:hypothetical protein
MSTVLEDKIKRFKELVRQGYTVGKALREAKLRGQEYKAHYEEIWGDPEMAQFRPKSDRKEEVEKGTSDGGVSPTIESTERLKQYFGEEEKTELERKWDAMEKERAAIVKAAMKIAGMYGRPGEIPLLGEREGLDPFEEFQAAFNKFQETRGKIKEMLDKMGFKVEDTYMKRDEVEKMMEEVRQKTIEEGLDDRKIEAVQNIVSDAVKQVVELFKPAVQVLFTPKEATAPSGGGETRKQSEEASASQQSSA